MKTLVLYGSKYGGAAQIAKRIAGGMGDAGVWDLKADGAPALEGVGRVIIGGSLYAGRVRKEVKTFITAHQEVLKGKEVGLFLSGMDGKSTEGYFSSNFPAWLLAQAKAKAFLGGIFDPGKTGGFDRFVMGLVAKHKGYVDTIDDEGIGLFVKAMEGGRE